MVEWDDEIPAWSRLAEEVRRAAEIFQSVAVPKPDPKSEEHRHAAHAR